MQQAVGHEAWGPLPAQEAYASADIPAQAYPAQAPTGALETYFVPLLMAAGAFAAGVFFGRSQQADVSMHAFQSVKVQNARQSMALHASAEEIEEEIEMAQLDCEEKMDNCVEAMKDKFASIRTGRANPALLDRIKVDYYGSLTPLKQLAGISIPDASTIVISPFDKSVIRDIEKVISSSDLGLTPNNDGERIRLNIPMLTTDRRKEMVKLASAMNEEGKVQLRNIRRDTLKAGDKIGMSEDSAAAFKDDIQKLTDKYNKTLDQLFKEKEKDLTTL